MALTVWLIITRLQLIFSISLKWYDMVSSQVKVDAKFLSDFYFCMDSNVKVKKQQLHEILLNISGLS